jgi:hypothetical protein
MDKPEIKSLKKRYLVWLYKTTKEALDRTERKFTQLEIDKFILKELNRLDKDRKAKNFVQELKTYIQNKEKEGVSLKYEGKELKPEYYFLALKLKAIEKAIAKKLGKSSLEEIKRYYEEEMTRRILQERQEKR